MVRSDFYRILHKWLLGFVLVYFVLYLLPFPLDVFPGLFKFVSTMVKSFWDLSVVWTGEHILHLDQPISLQPNGSGDRLYNYVQFLVQLFLALILASIYIFIHISDSKRNRIYLLFLTYLRYALATVILSYGFSKVIKQQFPSPTLERLLQPLGGMSPMGIAWTFMGFSTAYTVFAGLCEVVGGTLLLFRRTTSLGALTVAAVMLNVVMLNFSYDIPVKLYSLHLLLMAIVIFSAEWQRYWNFFIVNKAVAPNPYVPLVQSV